MPASQVIIPEMLSMLIILFIRSREMTISSKTGTEPPTKPVLPPIGEMARLFL